jgi:hypothetical protein
MFNLLGISGIHGPTQAAGCPPFGAARRKLVGVMPVRALKARLNGPIER